MRRSIVLATVLAASTAIFGACGATPENVKPASTTPTSTATPVTSPSVAPSTSPTNVNVPKANTSPEVKKPETNGNKEVKPVTNVNATPHK